MSELNKNTHKVGIFIMWFSLFLVLIAGISLLYVYKSDAVDFIGYYIAGLVLSIGIYAAVTYRIKQNKPMHILIKTFSMFWILIIMGSSFVGMGFAYIQNVRENFSAAPFLNWTDEQDPTSAITISWITSKPTNTILQYGLNSSNLNESITFAEKTRFHHVAIKNLTADTTYYYQVSPYTIKQFTTAPSTEENFTFFFWTDHRTNSGYDTSIKKNNQPNVVEYIAAYAKSEGITPAFSICSGDITATSNDYQTWKIWYDDIASNDWASNHTIQMAFGNHERHSDASGTHLKAYYPYNVKPDGHFYHSFDYGAAHFIMLDPYNSGADWGPNFTVDQLTWLENDLATHQAAKFTVISMHPPPIYYYGLKTEIARLSELYSIDLILCGHYHDYDVKTFNGTTQIIAGIGGNPNNEFNAFECDTGFLRVDINSTQMKVQSRFINGTVLDNLNFNA